MSTFFYVCKCSHEFRRDIGEEIPPSEKQLEEYKFAKCPVCKKKVELKDFLPKKSYGLFRISVGEGQFKGEYLTRMM